MGVRACVCHELPFEWLLSLARREGLAFEALRDRTGCCTSCSLCEPYVREMLESGRTDFEVKRPNPKVTAKPGSGRLTVGGVPIRTDEPDGGAPARRDEG